MASQYALSRIYPVRRAGEGEGGRGRGKFYRAVREHFERVYNGIEIEIGGDKRTYSLDSIRQRIAKLEGNETHLAGLGKSLPEDKQGELTALREALSDTEVQLLGLPAEQQEWLYVWELCSSQRYGQGMCLGTLVHSEIWNNLRELGVYREERFKYFHVVNRTDAIFREYAEKAKDRKGARSSEGIQTVIKQREAEMERGSKSIKT